MKSQKIEIKNKNQIGGLTVGNLYISPKTNGTKQGKLGKWASWATIIATIIGLLVYFGIDPNNIFKNKENKKETYYTESNNQTGGLTAGKIEELTIFNQEVQVPEPQLELQELTKQISIDNGYQTELLLSINTITPIPNLHLKVEAPTITYLDVTAQRTGLEIQGVQDIQEGYAFTNLQNAYGKYKITVRTREKDFLNITYDY